MGKYLLLLISLGILGGLGTLGILGRRPGPTPAPVVRVEQPVKPQAKVVIENGEIRTEATVSAKTAFEALEIITSQQHLTPKVKQYDFGVFVEGIGGVDNTKDKAWIYFVNGKSPEMAADKYLLKPGDVVEWKYIKPPF